MNVKKLRIKFFFKRKNSLQFEISHWLQIFWNIFFCKKWILFNQLKTHRRKSNKGHACIYGLLKKCRKHKLSIDCQLYIFDITILLILLCGSEIWDFENIDLIEIIHLRFCKLFLHIKQSTLNFMVYGEFGR